MSIIISRIALLSSHLGFETLCLARSATMVAPAVFALRIGNVKCMR